LKRIIGTNDNIAEWISEFIEFQGKTAVQQVCGCAAFVWDGCGDFLKPVQLSEDSMNAVRAGIVLSRLMTAHNVADVRLRNSEQVFVYLLPKMRVL